STAAPGPPSSHTLPPHFADIVRSLPEFLRVPLLSRQPQPHGPPLSIKSVPAPASLPAAECLPFAQREQFSALSTAHPRPIPSPRQLLHYIKMLSPLPRASLVRSPLPLLPGQTAIHT